MDRHADHPRSAGRSERHSERRLRDFLLPRADTGADLADPQARLWTAVLFARHFAIAALAVAAALTPAIGPHRLWVAAAVVTIVLPYNIALDVHLRRTGRVHRAMPFADLALAAAFPLAVPTTWLPALLVGMCDVALHALGSGYAPAAGGAAVGAAGFALAAAVSKPEDGLIGAIAFPIAAAMMITTVGNVALQERRTRRRYAGLVRGLDAIVWEADPETLAFTFVSERARDILGYPPEAWLDDPAFWPSHLHPDDRDAAVEGCLQATRDGRDHELVYRMVAADGRVVWLRDLARVETDDDGGVVALRGVMIDVTRERHAEEQIRRYADIVEHMQSGLYVWHLEDPADETSLRLVAANPASEHLSGKPRDDILGTRIFEAYPELAGATIAALIADVVRTGRHASRDDVQYANDVIGQRSFSLNVFPLPGDTAGYLFEDVTSRRRAEGLLRHQALHDALTGLPNRTLLHERLDRAIAVAQRNREPAALLLMDLDQFKEVNDTLGHQVGDLLLQRVAQRLGETVRESDTIARLGGDEFAILLTTDAGPRGAEVVAHRIDAALAEPFELSGLTLQTRASIGIALYPEHAGDADTLVQRADIAMYAAKRAGIGHAFYLAERDRSSVRRLTLVGELRRAIDEDELEVQYQPALDLATGATTAVEALVRWRHPSQGLLAPGEFIEVAEVAGLIGPLSWWVLERALVQCRQWTREGVDLGVAVNVSARNLHESAFAENLAELLRATAVPGRRLTLEITERELMDDPLRVTEVLDAVHRLGVRVSIDDFGTGYSSLSHLRRLPVNEVKIDRSFVSGMLEDESDAVIVRAIIDLSHDLGLEVVAEGVEEPEVLDALKSLGCDRAQGYLLGRPASAAELELSTSEASRVRARPHSS